MNGVRSFQGEGSNFDFELFPARANHLVSAAHGAGRRFERAPGGVLVRGARGEYRLLADYPLSFHLVGAFKGVADDPVTADELHGVASEVGDANGVLEHPSART